MSGLGARLLHAFSLKRNLRALVVPPRGHNVPLDGMRAIALFWVIAAHTTWSRGLGKYPRDVYREMLSSPDPLLRTLLRGDPAVFTFFALSGFLIGTMLLKELRATGDVSLTRFYWRRYLKLTPVYTFVVIGFCSIPGFPNRGAGWANVLYVNNFLPRIEDRTLGWTWTLAVEEQFYLTMPLLLIALYRKKRLVLGMLALLVVGLGVRVLVAHRFSLFLPIPPLLGDPRWAPLTDQMHIKPYTCYACFLPGVLAAWVHHAVPAEVLRARLRRSAKAIFVAGIGINAAVVYAPVFDSTSRWPIWASDAYMAVHPAAVSATAAHLILILVHGVGPGAWLSRVLSFRPFYSIAQLSYSTYLVHQVLIWIMYLRVKPAPVTSTFQHLPWIVLASAVSLSLGAILFLFVERPALNLRPSTPHRTTIEPAAPAAAAPRATREAA